MAKTSSIAPSTASKILVILLIIVGTGLIFSLGASAFGAFGSIGDRLKIDTGTYQAVHLTDGQIMFGKLSVIDQDNLSLSNVYYINDTSVDLKTSKASLVRHKSQPYGPQGSVIINRDQVLYWENLEDTGLVTKTIMQDDGSGDEN